MSKLLPASVTARILLLCLMLVVTAVAAVTGMTYWNVRAENHEQFQG